MRGYWAGLAAALIAASAPVAAQEYRPAFDPSRLKRPAARDANEVLVLGTPHLSGWPETFSPSALDPLLDRLAAWRPQMVAIEALSGMECDVMRRYPHRYSDSVENYCWDPAPARAATGLDVPAATAEAERLLASWPSSPDPSQRRRLAAVFLAGGEQTSALVQWLRLQQAERRAGDGLDAALVARLELLRTRRNENYLIAAPLAARLGLERVHAFDDHLSDSKVTDEKAFAEAMTRAWNNPTAASRKKMDEAMAKQATSGANVLAAYRAYNEPVQAELAYRGDFGAALQDRSPQQIGRGYVGWWETRNLRMAANIRDALARSPGRRMLVLVGASHKGYLEAYLDMMHDVQVADTGPVLR